MHKLTKNKGASVRARLLNLAKERNQPFNLLLTRYVLERFLYRLGQSKYRNRFILKGAMLMTAWFNNPLRPTRDIDLLGTGKPDSEAILKAIWDIATIQSDDAVVFDAEALPADVKVLIVADRGFSDHKLYRVLTEELKFDYLIRLRGNIKVTSTDGQTRSATDWVGKGGRSRILRGCAVTAQDYKVGSVVCVQAKDMKAPWCLVTNRDDEKVKTLLTTYAKRWSIECSFRDSKNPRFGMGMSQVRISSPERRDRLWLLNALAVALLTLLGAAGEAVGLDKYLKASTAKRREHSLFRQGCMHYMFIPTMRENHLRMLMEKFSQLLLEQPAFANIYGFI